MVPRPDVARHSTHELDAENGEFSLKPCGTKLRESLRHRILSEDFEDESENGAEYEIGPREAGLSSSWEWCSNRLLDILLISGLAAKLFTYLFRGIRWWFKFVRLVLFTLLLLPGFSQMVIFYFFSPRLYRSIPYGDRPRNRLDIYLPRRKYRRMGRCPVVIYVTGGAWTIGYKAWGALFGRRLSQRGVLVFCLDYRNFPQGSAMDMLEDVNTGIAWVLANLELYGGDAESIFLMGQSAGGHLTSLALLAQARQHSVPTNGHTLLGGAQSRQHSIPTNGHTLLGGSPPWDILRLKGFIGVSGAYNLVTLADHLHRRGLYRNLFEAIMVGPDGTPMLTDLSPSLIHIDAVAVALLPPIVLLHGTADKSVPLENAEEFAARLKKIGANCKLHRAYGKTHTQPIIEDPMRGGQDKLMDQVLSIVRGSDKDCCNLQFPMLPSVFIDAATWVCPF